MSADKKVLQNFLLDVTNTDVEGLLKRIKDFIILDRGALIKPLAIHASYSNFIYLYSCDSCQTILWAFFNL